MIFPQGGRRLQLDANRTKLARERRGSPYLSLLELATRARENAYAPYSRFKVGAALRSTSGASFVGVNVENVAYPEGTCAEAGAIAAMVAAGETVIAEIAGDRRQPLAGAALRRLPTKDRRIRRARGESDALHHRRGREGDDGGRASAGPLHRRTHGPGLMDARAIIARIRDGGTPSAAELSWFAAGLASGAVSDAQAGAFAMAVLLKGIGEAGRVALTRAMRDSGKVLEWDLPGPVLDKHSTGGIGDCVSLALAPALAACGAYVPMISGRGLGHTGGTLDKLESIPGFRTGLSEEQLRRQLTEVRCAIVSASPEIAPADRRLYAIRDVTGTVESVDLITASILSKKLAAGLEALVLDVKCGSGAFMKTLDEAEELANALVSAAQGAGCMTSALITDMSQPLATAAGNALEVIEVMETLTGTSVNAALWDLTVALGGEALALGGIAADALDGEGADHPGAGNRRRGRFLRPDGRGAGRPGRFRRPLARPPARRDGDPRRAEPGTGLRHHDRRRGSGACRGAAGRRAAARGRTDQPFGRAVGPRWNRRRDRPRRPAGHGPCRDRRGGRCGGGGGAGGLSAVRDRPRRAAAGPQAGRLMARAFLIVMDSVGCGGAPDAAAFGDRRRQYAGPYR